MGIFTRSHKQSVVTTTKPSLIQRLKGERPHTTRSQPHTVHTTGRARAAPRAKKVKVARANGTTRNGVPRRKTSVGDKVSGLMMKMKGSATHRPGEKAAGTRRMHGTDGRGSRRVYY